MFETLLSSALEAGIDINKYWDMTYGEIVETIKAYNRKKRTEMQWNASVNYTLANLIGLNVSRILGNAQDYPTIDSTFPGLFDEIIKEQKQIQDWRIAKERMADYAKLWNAQRGK